MRVVCQYCGSEVRTITGGGDLVSHGVCVSCAPHMEEEFMATRTVVLSDLLPDGPLRKLVPILNMVYAGTLDVSAGKAKIMEVLEPHRESLLAKGVLAEYLAWYLVSHATQGGSMPDLPVRN